jgi:predicted nucleic acid-binding protein
LKHYFLETSAFVKLFVQESGTEFLVRLAENVEDTRKLVSSLAALEVRAAFLRRMRQGRLSEDQTRSLLDAVTSESNRIVEQPVNASVLELTRYVLDRHPLNTVQGIHLATALTARDILQLTEVVFVSSDADLIEAATAEGLKVLNPEKVTDADLEEDVLNEDAEEDSEDDNFGNRV